MEIGDKAVDDAEPVARRDEDVGVASEGMHPSRLVGGAFQQAERGRADSDEPPARGPYPIQTVSSGGIDPPPLAVHDMVLRVFGFDWKKGSSADVKRERFVRNTRRLDRVHHSVRKVKGRRWRGDGALFAREHGLVIVYVSIVGGPLGGDIGRQRHPPCPLQQEFDGLFAFEAEKKASIAVTPFADGRHAAPEIHPVAVTDPFRVANKGAPLARSLPLVKRCSDPCLATSALQLRRDHLCVVEDEAIPGAQQSRQIDDDPILKPGTSHHQQPSTVARRRWSQGDPIRRKRKVEKVDAHGAAIAAC